MVMVVVKCMVVFVGVILMSGVFATDCTWNIGTVLFAPSDANKDCWSADALALLTSRMVLEGILPDIAAIDVNDGQMINDVIEYFRLLLEVVRKNTVGKTKHIMLMALTDTIGGYMKHFFLPISKYAYYAGNIDYNLVVKVHQLFDELKNYLRTNGAGWSLPPKDIARNVTAEPISLETSSSKTDPCKGLVFASTPGAAHKKKRRAVEFNLEIPMPYFDSKTHPSAIAVPFKAYSLRNVESKSAAYVLVKYYIASTKCLTSKTGSEKSVQEFNTNLFAFLMKKVVPHFPDEKFYSAFGGVLRIVETMKSGGYVKNGKVIGSYNIMPDTDEKNVLQEQMQEQQEQEEKNILSSAHGVGHAGKGGKMMGQKDAKHRKNKSNLILLAALATIIIWFFLGACFICCRIRSARIKRDEQLKLIEGATEKSVSTTESAESVTSKTKPLSAESITSKAKHLSAESSTSRAKCFSSESLKAKCLDRKDKDVPCTQATCPNFASSSVTIIEVDQEKEDESVKSETASKVDEEETPKSRSTQSSRTSSEKASATTSPKSSAYSSSERIKSAQYYPATFACHSSMAGKYKVGSSTDEPSSKDTIKKPFVFGYDFQTTSEESSPRETSDGETEMGGNMSK